MAHQERFYRDAGLLHRHPGNPILSAADWPYPAHSVFNPGATLLLDGTTLLLCRVEDRRGFSHLTAARSANGVDGWEIDPQPTLLPDPQRHPHEVWGIQDPRIVYMAEVEKYTITYVAYSPAGPAISLSMTEDFHSFEHHGAIMHPEDKDASLIPRKIHDDWHLIHRPKSATLGDHMWISSSRDLSYWGNQRLLLRAREGAWWDAGRVGLCPPPIETTEGWLIIYHGVRDTAAGELYRIGLALLDLENPEECLIRSDEWIFSAEEPYEVFGDVGYKIFPCGYTIAPDGDTLSLYYGAADTCVALATGSLREMLGWLKEHGRPCFTEGLFGPAHSPLDDHE
jgi:predicted GH43/DUF377 family glycosyl hydrolase